MARPKKNIDSVAFPRPAKAPKSIASAQLSNRPLDNYLGGIIWCC